MTVDKIKNRINEICSHFIFEYNGVSCGVDPISKSHFEMWCDDNNMTAKSINEVMDTPFFNGKALENIADEIEIIDW